MSTTRFLFGLSLAALAAGQAFAQQTNTSEYNQTGTGNSATIDNTEPGNTNNSSTIVQNGVSNNAVVVQRQASNRSFISQLGTVNSAQQLQTGTANAAEARQNGDFLSMGITQVGTSNSSTLRQEGTNNRSVVRQGIVVGPEFGQSGEQRPTSNNTATIEQIGFGLSSTINQRGASVSAPAANANRVEISQRSTARTSSVQQNSTTTQESRGDFIRVVQTEGSAAAANQSSVTQRNSGGLGGGANTANSASVTQAGVGLSNQVTQDGLRASATVTQRGGTTGENRGLASVLEQTGTDLRAAVTQDRLRGNGSLGNRSTVNQTGAGHQLDSFQYGTGGTSTVRQANGPNTGSGVAARAFVSQTGSGDVSAVNQTGDGLVDVVQAFSTFGTVTIDQVDAGDIGGARASNSVLASQYGDGNRAAIRQNAFGTTATIWQRVGSRSNTIDIAQGVGETVRASGAAAPGSGTTPLQNSPAVSSRADVIQGGSLNDVSIAQDGSDSTAAVTQAGAGQDGFRNLAAISQTGSNNRAAIRQGIGVGPSNDGDVGSGQAGDEFVFGGGRRSAEARILQTNTGNRADIDQEGRGQRAQVEQTGANNLADIFQDTGATNATAVIRQSGNANSYYIVQNQPGQYVSVSQTGDANTINQVVQRGAPGGNGFVPQ